MVTRAPKSDIDENKVQHSRPKKVAVGVPAVVRAMQMANDQMGVGRSIQTLLKVNQKDGFDCPGCAWPENDHRHIAEFCENGAKAVAEEATLRRVGPEFFALHSVDDLEAHDDYWLGQQGRLTHPMVLDEGATHYQPISWDDALREIADALRDLDDPDEAVFYTSGRTSNEAAFLYQLLVRGLGTNNLPDCSNMCHESSGSALTETIGIGKGTVSIDDIYEADLIIVAGQNPGTNHPRMLTALEKAKQKGATIIAVNPLPEAGLLRFENPQTVRGVALGGTKMADEFVQIRLGGDQALFQAIGKHLLEVHPSTGSGTGSVGVLDSAFIAEHTSGFEAYRQAMTDATWPELVAATGITEKRLRKVAEMVRASKATIVCWAMGLTQHKHSVPMIREIVNVLLLQGNIGRPGAGVCPVRGHSNVQGDRTVGIYEKPSEQFLDALDAEFGFAAPREHGYDTVNAIRAMRDGRVRVFMGMGGNFVSATPDTRVTEAAMRTVDLTVQVSTKLNRSHTVTGKRAIILPTLGRTDRDRRGGREQRVSVEDSMGAVHSSRGRLAPPSEELLSEVAIVARLCAMLFGTASVPERAEGSANLVAAASNQAIRPHQDVSAPISPDLAESPDFGGGADAAGRGAAPADELPHSVAEASARPDYASGVEVDAGQPERRIDEEAGGPDPAHLTHERNVPYADWAALESDYALIRDHIGRVIPGFEDYDQRIDKGRTFWLPNGPRDERRFATADGRAQFTVNPLEYPRIPRGRLLLQTIRSHDQYNTTIYGKDDRYRGIYGGRRVVMVNAKDVEALGFREDEIVDLVSEWAGPDGVVQERRAEEFRIVTYRTPRGNAAAYYPETNVLVPLDSVADVSGTPTSKSVVVRLEHRPV